MTDDKNLQPQTPKGKLPNVGRQLQQKRRELKLSIGDVAEQIRLRPGVLKAMEENKFSEMTEPVYTRGFLRTYANFLGLNGQDMVKALEAQEKLPADREMYLPTPVDEGALPARGVLLVSLAVLLLIALVWQGVSWMTPETKDKLPDMPHVVPPAEQQEGAESAANTNIPAPDMPEVPATAFQTPAAVDATGQPKSDEVVTPKPVPVQPAGARIRLYAEEDVWIRLQTPDLPEPLIAETLPAGTSYWVPNRENLLLDVGLPPALIVYIDGERMGKSGMIDRRVWNLPLDADNLKENYFGRDIHLTPNTQRASTQSAGTQSAGTQSAGTQSAGTQPERTQSGNIQAGNAQGRNATGENQPQRPSEGGEITDVVVEDQELMIQKLNRADQTPPTTTTETDTYDRAVPDGTR